MRKLGCVGIIVGGSGWCVCAWALECVLVFV